MKLNFWPFKKKKEVIKLNDLANAVKQLATEYNETYIDVRVSFNSLYGYVLEGYINGFQYASGKTIYEVVFNLRKQKLKVAPPNIEDKEIII
jgi:hypothetical protein